MKTTVNKSISRIIRRVPNYRFVCSKIPVFSICTWITNKSPSMYTVSIRMSSKMHVITTFCLIYYCIYSFSGVFFPLEFWSRHKTFYKCFSSWVIVTVICCTNTKKRRDGIVQMEITSSIRVITPMKEWS